MRLFQRRSASLDAHPTSHLAHRFEQRQRTALPGDGFISDGRYARLDEIGGLLGVGSEVEVGVEDLTFAQFGAFDRLRLLDLHHHLALSKNRIGSVDDLRASGDILFVGGTNAEAGTAFDPDLVPAHDQFASAFRRQADAIFVVLDFLGATDAHGGLLVGALVTSETSLPQPFDPACYAGCEAVIVTQLQRARSGADTNAP